MDEPGVFFLGAELEGRNPPVDGDLLAQGQLQEGMAFQDDLGGLGGEVRQPHLARVELALAERRQGSDQEQDCDKKMDQTAFHRSKVKQKSLHL